MNKQTEALAYTLECTTDDIKFLFKELARFNVSFLINETHLGDKPHDAKVH